MDDGENPESVTMPDRNKFHCDGDGYSFWLFLHWLKVSGPGGKLLEGCGLGASRWR